jgi:hypothetical protein
MKEATGELDMTIVTIMIVGAFFIGITFILPRVFNNTNGVWGNDSRDHEVNFGK